MKSFEDKILDPTNALLNQATQELFPFEQEEDARLSVLEVVSATYAGWPVRKYWDITDPEKEPPVVDPLQWATTILESIKSTDIPVPLALSALAREILPRDQQRKTGAYYTDWRLAQMLAEACIDAVGPTGLWIDPSCGSGILLVAAVLACPVSKREHIIRDQLCGADLSSRALRGTLLSVSSLAASLDTISSFRNRLFCGDSLRNHEKLREMAPYGFALVIGNPPWDRLRPSRHETVTATGQIRHYGQGFNKEVDLSLPRSEIFEYLKQVIENTQFQGKGDHDLYKLFLELGLGLTAENGIVAQLVPAGLIRSKGTEPLRNALNELASDLSIFVLENRQRHFAIDSRFKFLAVIARVSEMKRKPIILRVADRNGLLPQEPVRIERTELKRIRTDLSIPEVRSTEEWELFARLTNSGVRVGEISGPWKPFYQRELDMTNDRKSFERSPQENAIPIIEGRHVSQFRYRAKSYVHGEGRAAIWKPETLSSASLVSQWFIASENLRERAALSSAKSRIGFCDISGQSNERTLLAARIPAGVVCGNKVPTLTFPEGGAAREDLFIAFANSLIVDWLLRRLVTTTVNYFLLDSLPFPKITESSLLGSQILSLSRKLSDAEGKSDVSLWQVARWRAEIDALTAISWGIGLDDMKIILQDFPLLDRGQPTLPGEQKSTITADLVFSTLATALGDEEKATTELNRITDAQKIGAIAYIPAEYSSEKVTK